MGLLKSLGRPDCFGCEQALILRTLSDLPDLTSQTVLLRCDLNVPMTNGVISDDGRIRASLETIRFLVGSKTKVVICSHLGRPGGQPNVEYSLRPVAMRLSELLGQRVSFSDNCVGDSAAEATNRLVDGEVLVLENLRFHGAETSDSADVRESFARLLTQYSDSYVGDGFGVMHRKQASVYEAAKLLPSVAGFLVRSEVDNLSALSHSTKRPYTVVLGGAKVSDKLAVIEALLPKVDNLLVGGGMVFTFLAALGHKVGKSLVEQSQIDVVSGYLLRAEKMGIKIILPTDIVMASAFSASADSIVANTEALEETSFGSLGIGLDIGPASAAEFARIIESSATCFWNGPMGVFEFDHFSSGTRAVASALTKVLGLGVVGGGDSAAAVRKLGFQDSEFGYISTGGGASLEYLEGKSLPGLEVLS